MKLTSKLLAVFAVLYPLSIVAQTRAGVEKRIRSRELSYEKIAGYEPGSQVTDHVSTRKHINANKLCQFFILQPSSLCCNSINRF